MTLPRKPLESEGWATRPLGQVLPAPGHVPSEQHKSASNKGGHEGVKQTTLVGTKLRPPPVHEQSIQREHLLERLRRGSDRRLTLVACPAGFGKTTLLSGWYEAEADRRPVAWLTLDEGDNDPVVLWAHALGALRRANPNLAKSKSAQSVVAPVIDLVLPRLVNELDGQGELTLILDDFHRISSESARASVRWFIEHAPPGFHVVVATRTEPKLPVATLRAHGDLLELRAADLRFTLEEADAFLNDRLGLDLRAEDVDFLVEKTQGWPAGLYLAALSLQPSTDRHTFVRTFGGSNRHVVDFLVTEVLEAHTPAEQTLMLHVFGSRTIDRPSVRRRAGPTGFSGDARVALTEQPVPCPARRRGRVVPLSPRLCAAVAGGARAARARTDPGAPPPGVLLASRPRHD